MQSINLVQEKKHMMRVTKAICAGLYLSLGIVLQAQPETYLDTVAGWEAAVVKNSAGNPSGHCPAGPAGTYPGIALRCGKL